MCYSRKWTINLLCTQYMYTDRSVGLPITMGLRLVASFSEEEDDVSDAVRLNCRDNGCQNTSTLCINNSIDLTDTIARFYKKNIVQILDTIKRRDRYSQRSRRLRCSTTQLQRKWIYRICSSTLSINNSIDLTCTSARFYNIISNKLWIITNYITNIYSTICPRRSDSFYIVTCYIKWVITSSTCSMQNKCFK